MLEIKKSRDAAKESEDMAVAAQSLREIRHSLFERCKKNIEEHKCKTLHAPVVEPRIIDGGAVSDLEYVVSRKPYTPEVERTVVLDTEKDFSVVPKSEINKLIDANGMGTVGPATRRGTPSVPGGANVGHICNLTEDEEINEKSIGFRKRD